MSRPAMVAALEALEAGDVRLAVDVLLGALEDDVVPDVDVRREVGDLRGANCPVCGVDLRWPGQVEAHVINVHPDYGMEAA